MRIRRAFGVADVVSDGHARAALIARFATKLAAGLPGDQPAAAEAILEAILDAGARSQLDHCLVDGDFRKALADMDDAVTVTMLVSDAVDSESAVVVRELVESIIGAVVDSVSSAPFEDAHLHWYALGSPAGSTPAPAG